MIREILPVTIYGHFVSLFIFLLITDLLRYRPVILLGGLSAVACWAMTIYSYNTKSDAIVSQFTFKFSKYSTNSNDMKNYFIFLKCAEQFRFVKFCFPSSTPLKLRTLRLCTKS